MFTTASTAPPYILSVKHHLSFCMFSNKKESDVRHTHPVGACHPSKLFQIMQVHVPLHVPPDVSTYLGFLLVHIKNADS